MKEKMLRNYLFILISVSLALLTYYLIPYIAIFIYWYVKIVVWILSLLILFILYIGICFGISKLIAKTANLIENKIFNYFKTKELE